MKPTKEQINQRAIDILLAWKNCINCVYNYDIEICKKHELCPYAIVQSALEKAEMQLAMPTLAEEEKKALIDVINSMERASGHKYYGIELNNNGFYPSVWFFYRSKRYGDIRYDSISGTPCYTTEFEPNTEYLLSDLLEDKKGRLNESSISD